MLLKLSSLTKSFHAPGSGNDIKVLNSLNFQLDKNETAAIFGPSGSGKSTLLNLISALDSWDSGEIYFRDHQLPLNDTTILAEYRNQKIGIIFQEHHLLPQLNLLENILLPAIPGRAANSPAIKDRAFRLLDRVGLKNRFDHLPAELSGGEKQRGAVVRALINSPELLLADEPTGSLDQKSAKELIKLLVEIGREEGVAMIIATHDEPLMTQVKKRYRLT